MSDEELFHRVGSVLEARGGWHYEAATTPGALPSWCLDPGGSVAVSVNVIDGAVVAYLPASDREIRLQGIEGLTVWLDTREGR
jgi:hypothetical protein